MNGQISYKVEFQNNVIKLTRMRMHNGQWIPDTLPVLVTNSEFEMRDIPAVFEVSDLRKQGIV